MAKRQRNNKTYKTSSPNSHSRNNNFLPKLRDGQQENSQYSRKKQLYNLVKPGTLPTNKSMNKTYMQTPFKAMKHYVQKNFDAPNSVDPLMLDTSLDMDTNFIEIN